MSLKAKHVLGLGTAVGIDFDLFAIAGALPASRAATEHLAKNDCNRILAVVLSYQEEILVAEFFEVIRDVLRIFVLVLIMTTGREVLTVIRIVVDCSTI